MQTERGMCTLGIQEMNLLGKTNLNLSSFLYADRLCFSFDSLHGLYFSLS